MSTQNLKRKRIGPEVHFPIILRGSPDLDIESSINKIVEEAAELKTAKPEERLCEIADLLFYTTSLLNALELEPLEVMGAQTYKKFIAHNRGGPSIKPPREVELRQGGRQGLPPEDWNSDTLDPKSKSTKVKIRIAAKDKARIKESIHLHMINLLRKKCTMPANVMYDWLWDDMQDTVFPCPKKTFVILCGEVAVALAKEGRLERRRPLDKATGKYFFEYELVECTEDGGVR
jgi:hypothetical protein